MANIFQNRYVGLSGVSIAAILLTTTSVLAQTMVIEEVVVTAQKRAQSVNDIGVTAVALNGDRLKDVGIESPVDLGAFTPGLVTVNATSGGTPIFAIRGIGLDDFSPNNSSGVGIYTNEVFASNPVFLNGLLFDIDRVEVLKGPQGTLYGFNTTGGAINFITNKPTEETTGYIKAGFARFNTIDIEGAVSGALANTVRARVAGTYANASGWQTDVDTGRQFGGQNKLGLRGMVEFDLGDETTILVEAHYSKDTSTPTSPQIQGLGDFFLDPSFDLLNTPTGARDVTVGALDVRRDEEGYGGSLTLKTSFGFADFVAITAFDEYDRFVVDNYGGDSAATLDFEQNNKIDQFSQEIRFVSNNDGPISWIVGANYATFKTEAVDTFDDSFLVTDSAAINFFFDPADVPIVGDDLIIADYVQKTTSLGVYLHTEAEVSETVKVIAGLRYSNDERSFEGTDTNISFGDVIPIINLSDDFSEGKVNWKIGVNWTPNVDSLLYASAATSYKAGTYYGAPVLDDVAWSFIGSEDVLAYEVGLKQSLMDGAMQMNVAAFRLEYDDRQSLITFVADDFSNFLLIPILDTTLINIPKSISQGFEVDFRWIPAEGWDITAGLAYLDAKITQGPNAAIRGIALDPGINDDATGDLDGDGLINNGEVAFVDALGASVDAGRLSQAPEFSYNFIISYETELSQDLVGRVQLAYSYAGDQVAQLSDPNAQYGPVKSLDAQLSLFSDESGWRVNIWGRNLTNNSSETYAFSGFAGRAVYRQKPVEYGIRLGFEF